MDSTTTFKYAGVSRRNNQYKVRFANDIARVKILAKTDDDIQMLELPGEMTKPELIKHLMTTELYSNPEYRYAIDMSNEKYNPVSKVKGAKVAPSLETLRERAKAPETAE